jgi:hypothetical protein
VLCAFGAFGACIQSLFSLGNYVGNREFRPQWGIYYVARPIVGAGLAAMLYVILRSGLSGDTIQVDLTQMYPACAVAIVVGLFSSQAMHKLAGLAEVLFASAQQKNALNRSEPLIEAVGVDQQHVDRFVIHGLNFNVNSRVIVEGEMVPENAVHFQSTETMMVDFSVITSPNPTVQIAIYDPLTGVSSNLFPWERNATMPIVTAVHEDSTNNLLTNVAGLKFNTTSQVLIHSDNQPPAILATTFLTTTLLTVPSAAVAAARNGQQVGVQVMNLQPPGFSNIFRF